MNHPKPSTRRQGVAIVVTIVLLAVLTVLLSVVTVQVVAQRKLVDRRQRQLQAEWLARSGVELAAARLLESGAAFSDDKQMLLPDTRLRITVEKAAADLYSVSVEARVGSAEELPVVRSVEARFRRTDSAGVVRVHAVPVK